MSAITRRTLLAGAVLAAAPRAGAQGKRTLRLSHGHPEADPVHKAALRLADIVAERTGGTVEVKVFPNGVLGGDPAIISGVRGGTIDLCWAGNPLFTGMAPKLNVLDLPFLLRDRAHVAKVLDGEIGEGLRAELHASNLLALATWEVGWRNITNNRRAVRTPDDVRGLKIRTTPNPAHLKAFQLLGATPVPMPVTELYTALETGTVDGQENPVTLILNGKFNEVQKHLSLTRHAFTSAPLVVNKARFEAIPGNVQAALREAAAEAGALQRRLNVETEATSLAALKKAGMQVVEEVDREPFRRIVFDAVREDFVARFGPELPDRIAAA